VQLFFTPCYSRCFACFLVALVALAVDTVPRILAAALSQCPLQIPVTMTEDMLRAMFTPYGNVAEVHLLKKASDSGGSTRPSGCGFVTFERWSACEAAIAALHGKTHLEGAKMPMVVKFADAKVRYAYFMQPHPPPTHPLAPALFPLEPCIPGAQLPMLPGLIT
jgi:hypothetical protein